MKTNKAIAISSNPDCLPVRTKINFDCLKGAKWHKIKDWVDIRKFIKRRVKDPHTYNIKNTLHYAPQLYKTLIHCSILRCITYITSKTGLLFVTHTTSSINYHMNIFVIESHDEQAKDKTLRYNIPWQLDKFIFVHQPQVFVSFSNDGLLRVIYFCRDNAYLTSTSRSLRSVLCFTFIPDTNEIVTGCIGFVETWYIKGIEHQATIHKGRSFNASLTPQDWVHDLKVDVKNQLLLILSEGAIFIIDYQENIQKQKITNLYMETASFRCCCFYNHGEYVITGSGDGCIKVWLISRASVIQEFRGHSGCVTSLQCHDDQPLLFSSSRDGSVMIWRLDNFQRFMKLEVGDQVVWMSLNHDEIICQTNREIKVYNLAHFYRIFAYIQSMVTKLVRYPGKDGKPNRILCAAEDGSFQLFSVLSGETLEAFFPLPFGQSLTEFCYNMREELMYTVLPDGTVLVIQTIINPCTVIHALQPKAFTERVVKLCCFDVSLKSYKDTLILAGLSNGKIVLLDARTSQFDSIKRHEKEITYLSTVDEMDTTALDLPSNQIYLASGSKDMRIKLWSVVVKEKEEEEVEEVKKRKLENKKVKVEIKLVVSLALLTTFECADVPSCICFSSNIMAVSYAMSVFLNLFRMSPSKTDQQNCISYELLSHSTDSDHMDEIIDICACPTVEIFVTRSKDGVLKIWDYENYLIKELVFNHHMSGLCFCNNRGDLLIGFHIYILMVSIVDYLPVEQLEKMMDLTVQDDLPETQIYEDFTLDPRSDMFSLVPQPIEFENQQKTVREVYVEWIEARERARIKLMCGSNFKAYRKQLTIEKTMKEENASVMCVGAELKDKNDQTCEIANKENVTTNYCTDTSQHLHQHLRRISIVCPSTVNTIQVDPPENNPPQVDRNRVRFKDHKSSGHLTDPVKSKIDRRPSDLLTIQEVVDKNKVSSVQWTDMDTDGSPGLSADDAKKKQQQQKKKKRRVSDCRVNDIEDFRKRRDSLMGEIYDLKRRKASITEDVFEHQNHLDWMDGAIDELERKKTYMFEVDLFKGRINDFKRRKSGIETNIDYLNRQISFIDSDIELLEQSRHSVADDITILKKNRAVWGDIKHLKAQKVAIKQAIEVVKKKNKLTGEIKDLEKRSDSVENDVKLLRKKLDSIEKDIQILRNNDSLKEGTEVCRLMNLKTTVEKDIEVLKKKQDMLTTDMEVLQDEMMALNKSSFMTDNVDFLHKKMDSVDNVLGVLKRKDSLDDLSKRRKSASKFEILEVNKKLAAIEAGDDEKETDGVETSQQAAMKPNEVGRLDYKLSPWERSLLDKDPIIAPDGYIPNSVVRKKKKWKGPFTQPLVITPGKGSETATTRGKSMDTVWFLDLEPEESDHSSQVDIPETERRPSQLLVAPEESPSTVQVEVEVEEEPSDEAESEADRKHRWVDDSLLEKTEGTANQIMSLMRRLCAEKFFPTDQDMSLFVSVKTLVDLLETNDANMYQKVCQYVRDIDNVSNVVQSLKTKLLNTMKEKLKSSNADIKINSLRMIAMLSGPNEEETDDLIRSLLPCLVDPDPNVRIEAIKTLLKLSGLKTKDELMDLLQELGVFDDMSLENYEAHAMGILEKRLLMKQIEERRLREEERIRKQKALLLKRLKREESLRQKKDFLECFKREQKILLDRQRQSQIDLACEELPPDAQQRLRTSLESIKELTGSSKFKLKKRRKKSSRFRVKERELSAKKTDKHRETSEPEKTSTSSISMGKFSSSSMTLGKSSSGPTDSLLLVTKKSSQDEKASDLEAAEFLASYLLAKLIKGLPEDLANDLAAYLTTDLQLDLPEKLSAQMAVRLVPGLPKDLADRLARYLADSLPKPLASAFATHLANKLTFGLPAELASDWATHLAANVSLDLPEPLSIQIAVQLKAGMQKDLAEHLASYLRKGLSVQLTSDLAAFSASSLATLLTVYLTSGLPQDLASDLATYLAANLSFDLPESLAARIAVSLVAGLPLNLSYRLASFLSYRLPIKLASALATHLVAKLTSGMSHDLAAYLACHLTSSMVSGLPEDLAVHLACGMAGGAAAQFVAHLLEGLPKDVAELIAAYLNRVSPGHLGKKFERPTKKGIVPIRVKQAQDSWKDLFKMPSALEHQRLYELERGKTGEESADKLASLLTCLDKDPLYPTESGIRLVHKITVSDKGSHEKCRVESVPGMPNVESGTTQFGIIKMEWNAEVPGDVTKSNLALLPASQSLHDSDIHLGKKGEKTSKGSVEDIALESDSRFDLQRSSIKLSHVAMSLPNATKSLPNQTKSLQHTASSLQHTASSLSEVASLLPQDTRSLPQVASSLSQVTSSLPQVASSLPQVTSSLPQVASSLLQVTGSLPQVTGSLSQVTGSLPQVTSSLSQVASLLSEVAISSPQVASSLPQVTSSLPQVTSSSLHMASSSQDQVPPEQSVDREYDAPGIKQDGDTLEKDQKLPLLSVKRMREYHLPGIKHVDHTWKKHHNIPSVQTMVEYSLPILKKGGRALRNDKKIPSMDEHHTPRIKQDTLHKYEKSPSMDEHHTPRIKQDTLQKYEKRLAIQTMAEYQLPEIKADRDTVLKDQKIPSVLSVDDYHLPRIKQDGQIFQWKLPHPHVPKSVSLSDSVVPYVRTEYHHLCDHMRLSKKKMHHYISGDGKQSTFQEIVEVEKFYSYSHYLTPDDDDDEDEEDQEMRKALELQQAVAFETFVQVLFSRS
ncbi:uncharacterized protein LOC121387427 [Gigantopelta aegis]|uniref:uncharacterized protein LOC121387427 n=1 Tax=Gigantopelta aegis TaxID=1735272 RepID=UPI001B88E757|nr:uncharacterized protein LOC121387427 [Gigantopelta aegis]